jgi:hypothetical protein
MYKEGPKHRGWSSRGGFFLDHPLFNGVRLNKTKSNLLRAVLSWLLIASVLIFGAAPLEIQAAPKSKAPKNAILVSPQIQARPGAAAEIPIWVRKWQGMPRQVLVLIRGLPKHSLLTQGRAFGPGVWAISPESKRLRVILGKDVSGRIPITITLVTLNGDVLANAKTELAVGRQDSIAVITEPAKKPLSPEAEKRLHYLIEKGNESLKVGRVTAARLFYKRAAEKGSPKAALALGGTYDAHELRYVKVFGGIQPNAKLARKWYTLAQRLGASEAKARLKRLSSNARAFPR